MEQIRDGGPAFPQPATMDGHPVNTNYGIAGGGMSYRQWLAGLAINGLLQCPGITHSDRSAESYAKMAQVMADAMIKQMEAK